MSNKPNQSSNGNGNKLTDAGDQQATKAEAKLSPETKPVEAKAADIPALVAKLSEARKSEREAMTALEAALYSAELGQVFQVDNFPWNVVERNEGTKEEPVKVRRLVPVMSQRQMAIARGETPPPMGGKGARGRKKTNPSASSETA